MERIRVIMIRENLDNLPEYPSPAGYFLRNYEDGDDNTWAAIETAAGEFSDTGSALKRFRDEFPNINEMKRRCLFLCDNSGREIGTATAWFNNEFEDGEYGRLHFVGIHPDYQGKGLGKALVGETMKLLTQFHTKAYLTSQTTSAAGIKIYLDFGFEPYIFSDSCSRAWQLLAREINHPALNTYL